MRRHHSEIENNSCERFWTDKGPNEFVSQHPEHEFVNKGPNINHFRRWRRPFFLPEERASILDRSQQMQLIVIGCVATYHNIDDVKQRLRVSIPKFVFNTTTIPTSNSSSDTRRRVPMNDPNNHGIDVMEHIVKFTSSRLEELQAHKFLENTNPQNMNAQIFAGLKSGGSGGSNYSNKNTWNSNNNGWGQQIPIIHLFCLDEKGHSYCVNAHGFYPYIYIPVPEEIVKAFGDTTNLDLWHEDKLKDLCESVASSVDSWLWEEAKRRKKNRWKKNKKEEDDNETNTEETLNTKIYESDTDSDDDDEPNSFNKSDKKPADSQKQNSEKISWDIKKSKSDGLGDEPEDDLDTYRKANKSSFNYGNSNHRSGDNDPSSYYSNEDYCNKKYVVKVEVEIRTDYEGSHKKKQPMFAFYFTNPSHINSIRTQLRPENKGFKFSFCNSSFSLVGLSYDSCILFENRFLINSKLHGGSWFHISKDAAKQVRFFEDNRDYKDVFSRDFNKCIARSQCEIDIHWKDLLVCDQDDPKHQELYSKPVEGVRVLSFDTEWVGMNCRFPQKGMDPSNTINVYATKDSRYPRCFSSKLEDYKDPKEEENTLSICFSVSSSNHDKKQALRGFADKNPTMFTFHSEREMWNAFKDFINIFDPDVITGFNSSNFDIPLSLDRNISLSAPESNEFSRLVGKPCSYKEALKMNKKVGSVSITTNHCPGRLCWDAMVFVREKFKFTSYNLNYVSYEFFKDTKDDMNHEMLPKLFKTGPKERDVVRMYCEKDAFLALAIFNTKQIWLARLEECRRLGIRLEQGEDNRSGKLYPYLLSLASREEKSIPYHFFDDGKERLGYEGGKVQDPIPGYYIDYIAFIVDFTSMFPSIIRAHNLCMTTYIPPDQLEYMIATYGPDCYTRTPTTGHCFLKKHIRRGTLPRAEEFLMNRRAYIKKNMKETKDKEIYAVQSIQEQTLKINSNSVYGVHGTKHHGTDWQVIAESVTDYARDQIEKTRKIFLREFPKTVIIYGDTDSLMGYYEDCAVSKNATPEEKLAVEKKSNERTIKICGIVTKEMPEPNVLNPEFIMHPCLLNKKKKYAGFVKEGSENAPRKPKIMGLDSQRRNCCKYTKETQEKCLEYLLKDINPQKAIEYAKERTKKLARFDVNPGELILSSRINKAPKGKRDAATVRPTQYLYQRMQELDPHNVPNIGDRVPYMVRSKDTKNQKNYSRTIHPTELIGDYAKQLDIQYYFECQFVNSLTVLLQYVDKNIENVLYGIFRESFRSFQRNDLYWLKEDQLLNKVVRKTLQIEYDENEGIDEICDEPMFDFKKKAMRLNSQETTTMCTKDMRSFVTRLVSCTLCQETKSNGRNDELWDLCKDGIDKTHEFAKTKSPKMYFICDSCIGSSSEDIKKTNVTEAALSLKQINLPEDVAFIILNFLVIEVNNTERDIHYELKLIHIDLKNKLNKMYEKSKEEAIKKWDICKKCMGEKFREDSCNNYECHNWFTRFQVKSKFTSIQKAMIDLEI